MQWYPGSVDFFKKKKNRQNNLQMIMLKIILFQHMTKYYESPEWILEIN